MQLLNNIRELCCVCAGKLFTFTEPSVTKTKFCPEGLKENIKFFKNNHPQLLIITFTS